MQKETLRLNVWFVLPLLIVVSTKQMFGVLSIYRGSRFAKVASCLWVLSLSYLPGICFKEALNPCFRKLLTIYV